MSITPGTPIKSITDLPIEAISSNDRLRPVSEAGVLSLIDSITDLGVMKDPIQVREVRKGIYCLMAGAHRLEAARRLGWASIPVVVWTCNDAWAALMEVDDNLAGAELTSLDQAVFLAERKRIYEKEFPGTTHGGDRGNQHTGGRQTDMMSFCQSTAEKFGITDRHVRRMVKAGDGLTPDLIRHLRGGVKAPTLADLQALSKVPERDRTEVVHLFASGGARSISAALDGIKPSEKKTDISDHDRQLSALRLAWGRAGLPARRAFLAEIGAQSDD